MPQVRGRAFCGGRAAPSISWRASAFGPGGLADTGRYSSLHNDLAGQLGGSLPPCAQPRPGRYRADWYQAGEQPSPGRTNAGNRAVNQQEAARGRGDRQVADQGGLADAGCR
jgi:hypothetical protein